MRPKLRFEVFSRDRFTCQYCGQSAPDVRLHVDHIIPRSIGGDDGLDNLAIACHECNEGKKAVLLPILLMRWAFLSTLRTKTTDPATAAAEHVLRALAQPLRSWVIAEGWRMYFSSQEDADYALSRAREMAQFINAGHNLGDLAEWLGSGSTIQ